MTIEELLVYGKKYTSSAHAKILLAEVLNLNSLELYNHLNETVSSTQEEKYKELIQSLKEGTPLQYALGKVNFYGIEYKINNNVLIPRFETEELVENTINYIKKYFNTPVDIIDLGCGSGEIGLTLEQKVPTNTVDLVDISKQAIEVTKLNHSLLKSKANIINNDFLNNIEKKYDVIISNPPYIKNNEEIEPIVKNNEPHLALYAGEDGLDCYKKILSNIKNNMKDRCLIAFEIGYEQAEDIRNLINKYLENVKVEIKKDLSGKDRMIFIFKNLE